MSWTSIFFCRLMSSVPRCFWKKTNTEQEGHMAGAAILLLNYLPIILDTYLLFCLVYRLLFTYLQTRHNAERKRLGEKGLIHILSREHLCVCYSNCAPSLGPAISTQKRMTNCQQKATCCSEKWKVFWRTLRTSWSLSGTTLLLWMETERFQ